MASFHRLVLLGLVAIVSACGGSASKPSETAFEAAVPVPKGTRRGLVLVDDAQPPQPKKADSNPTLTTPQIVQKVTTP